MEGSEEKALTLSYLPPPRAPVLCGGTPEWEEGLG